MHPDGRDPPARPDGRNSDTGRVLAWAPGLTGPDADAVPADPLNLTDLTEVADPTDPVESPGEDAFDDLDLTITPVSVTPPRTWRRAAWFAVGASCVVLTVLVFAAARLAGPESPFDRLDAFPGLPTGGLLTAQPPEPPGPSRPGDDPTAADGTTPTADGDPTSAGAAHQPGRQGEQSDRGPGGGPAGVTRTGSPTTTSYDHLGDPTVQPSVSLLPTVGSPPVTADSLIAATRSFYELLPKNVEAAWNMVGPRVKVQGFESFRKQWADAAQVHLQRVVVNANDSTVLATVLFVGTEDDEYVQRFLLTFRQGNALTIEEIQQTGDDGNKPVS